MCEVGFVDKPKNAFLKKEKKMHCVQNAGQSRYKCLLARCPLTGALVGIISGPKEVSSSQKSHVSLKRIFQYWRQHGLDFLPHRSRGGGCDRKRCLTVSKILSRITPSEFTHCVATAAVSLLTFFPSPQRLFAASRATLTFQYLCFISVAR